MITMNNTMEKIFVLVFTKKDFSTDYTSDCDGGGFVIFATRELEIAQKRLKKEVKKFIKERISKLQALEEEYDESVEYDEINFKEEGWWSDGMGWHMMGYEGWTDEPKFYIKEIKVD